MESVTKVVQGNVIELTILPLEEVTPHEETIPQIVELLSRDMARTGFQRDPVLVDRGTRFALDGMHRLAALKKIGAKYCVCALYDYRNSSVKLERWLRYFIAPDEPLVAAIVSDFDLEGNAEDYLQTMKRVDSGASDIALLSLKRSFARRGSLPTIEVYDTVKLADREAERSGVTIDFAAESQKLSLFTSESVFVLYPKPLRKTDVIEVVNRRALLPHKTTRHIVPIRPMGIYFKLSNLSSPSLADCSKELQRIVGLSTVNTQEREVWYEGRRYAEPIAIFRAPVG